MRETDLEKLIKVYWTFGKAWNKLLLAVQLTNGANDFWHDKCESGTLKGNNLITDCIAVSLYGPLQRAAVRACYVPGCPVHLSFDFVILLGFERNGDGDVTHIASLRVRHCSWCQKVGNAQNI